MYITYLWYPIRFSNNFYICDEICMQCNINRGIYQDDSNCQNITNKIFIEDKQIMNCSILQIVCMIEAY